MPIAVSGSAAAADDPIYAQPPINHGVASIEVG